MYDSATGDWTYRHYILAGGARVGVETIEGSTVTIWRLRDNLAQDPALAKRVMGIEGKLE